MKIEYLIFFLTLANVEMYPTSFINTALKYIQMYSRLNIGNTFALLHPDNNLENEVTCEDIQTDLSETNSNIFFQCLIWPETKIQAINNFSSMTSPSLLLFFGHSLLNVIHQMPKNMLIDNVLLIILDGSQSKENVESQVLERYPEIFTGDVALLDSQIYIMASINLDTRMLYEMYRKCWSQPVRVTELANLSDESILTVRPNYIWDNRKDLNPCRLRMAYFNTGYAHEMSKDTLAHLKSTVQHEFQYHARHIFDAGDKIMYGYGMILLNTLRDEFNFSVEWKFVEDKKFGALVPDTTTDEWNGIVGMLKRNEVDTSSLWLSITDARSAVISFAVPIVNIEYQLVMKRPVLSLSWGTYLTVFHTRYWTLLALLFVTCSLYFGYIFTKIEHNRANIEQHRLFKVVAENIISGFAAVSLALGALDINLAKPSINLKSFVSLRFLALMVCLFGMVNYYIYNAGLIARVMAHHPKMPINELDDFFDNNEYTLLIQEGSAQESYLRHTKKYHKIWKNSVNRKGLLGNENVNEGEQKIREDPRKVFFVEYPLFQVMDQHARKSWLMNDTEHGPSAWTNPCELVAAKRRYGLNSISFAFPQNSPYIKLFNYHIRRIKEKGLATESFNPNSETEECGKENSGGQFRKFSYDDVFSAFVVCAFGCFVAVMYCTFEKIKDSINRTNVYRENSSTRKHVISKMNHEYLIRLAMGTKEEIGFAESLHSK